MELGYAFHPPADPHALGHPALDIIIFDTPTGEHFDPHQAAFPICDPKLGLQNMQISHPGDPGAYQICTGRIILRDLVGKVVEAFSFGGELSIEPLEDRTACRLTSSAPIFDLRGIDPAENALVSEYEAVLGLLRAREPNDDLFEFELAAIDPLTLFITMSLEVEDRLHQIPESSRDSEYWALRRAIRHAALFVNPDGILPADHPRIASLLQA